MMQDAQTAWANILGELKNRVNRPTFETFIRPISPVAIEEGTLVLEAPNSTALEWIEEKVMVDIKQALASDGVDASAVKFLIRPASNEVEEPEPRPRAAARPDAQPQARGPAPGSNPEGRLVLNSRYTFETFVEGNSNKLAYAACQNVAENPGLTFNPLFVYGGVGLGKTHLLQAIAHYVLSTKPYLLVRYMSTERFTNDLISAIREKTAESFRNRYRRTDILILDDIQFLAGKEMTQEEFFHTFNELYESKKQIVISCDRPPKEIPNLPERLVSRFGSGLLADLQPPDLETRLVILKKKIALNGYDVHDEVLYFIAREIPSNIRDLEGALIRVIASASLAGQPINVELASEVLKDFIPKQDVKKATISEILSAVSSEFNISVPDIISDRKLKELVVPRWVAMYLSREITSLPLARIGEAFGGKDHTTILNAYNKIKEKIRTDPNISAVIQKIQNRLSE